MNIQLLMDQIERPDVQRVLLADYAGPFSIGIGADPLREHEPAVIVRVANAAGMHAPKHIQLDGELVRVIVQGDYAAPHPLKRPAS